MSSRAALTMTEPRVSVEDAAKHLGAVRDSVYRWIDGRYLPAHTFARLWKLTELDVWVRAAGADVHGADAEPKPKGKW